MRVLLVATMIAGAEAAAYVLRRNSCTGRGQIRSEGECRQAQKSMGLKTVTSYESWATGADQKYPGGFSVAGQGTEKADDNYFPYCSYIQAKDQQHFNWCANDGKCEFNRDRRDNRAVCRAYCSDVMSDSQCGAGKKVSRTRSGTDKGYCCIKDESKLDVLSEAFFDKCVKDAKDYAGFKNCAKGVGVSRLYADISPSWQTPSAAMPVCLASLAVFAACAAVVSYRRRRQPSDDAEQLLSE